MTSGREKEGHPIGASPNNTDQNQLTGGETRWEDLPLDPQHVDKLKSSGISPLAAELRGYETVHNHRRLADLGFAKALCRNQHVSPVCSSRCWTSADRCGATRTAPTIRARTSAASQSRYDTPVQQPNGLDIPPLCGGDIGDPKVEKWITEGSPKADALAEQGICAIAIAGVNSWKGRNDRGGKAALGDWNDIAIYDGQFVIAYDSDVMTKRSVRSAVSAITE